MPTTLSKKGQITIPFGVRRTLGLESGDRIEFVETKRGRFELIALNLPITTLKGVLRKPTKPVTIKMMNAAIAARGSK